MKKNLFSFLAALSIFSSTQSIQAQCSLNQVGNANYVGNSALSDMAITPNNVLYTISYNTGNSKFELYSTTIAINNWTLSATLTGSTTVKPAIAINKTGKVSVFLRDDNASGVGKVYYLSGGALVLQGVATSSASVTDLAITFDSNGDEFIAYTDVPTTKAIVKKWNSGSSTWVTVGSTGIASSGAAHFNSLALDNLDNPVLAFQDGTTAPTNKITVMKYSASTWSSLVYSSTNAGNTPKIKVASNNDYYLGYIESTANGIVQKYNGSVWAAVGASVSNLSTGSGFDLDLDPSDTPYFIAVPSTPPYPVAYRYTSTSWTSVASSISGTLTASNTNISIDNTGTPCFFYVTSATNGLNVKSLSSNISISTQPVPLTVCNGMSSAFNINAVGGVPSGYQWQTATVGTFTNAGASYSNATTNSLGFTGTPGINLNKVRCVLNVGCRNIISSTAILTVNTLNAAITSTNPTCFNTGNGVISSTVTGGTIPYTYSWSPVGGTAATASSLYGNTYTLTSNDAIGCTVSTAVTLTTPPSISSYFSGNMNVCIGSSTTLTVNASGGVMPYTFTWTPGIDITPTTGSVVTITPSSAQTYGVQITDAIGCVATNTVSLGNSLPSVSASVSSSVICSGTSINLLASGSADTYTWNPGNISGASPLVTPLANTTYTAVGTNTVNGCSNTATTSVIVNLTPTANAGPGKVLTCASTSTVLSGSTGGGVTYNWTGPGIVSGGTTLNPVVNAVGTYDLSVMSAAGCSSNFSPVSVTQNITPPAPTASTSGTVTCSAPNATLTGGPVTGVTYLWSGPGISGSTTTQTTTANAAGNYTLLVTSAINSCTNTAVTTVTQNTTTPTISASTSTSSICNGSSVTLSATGVGVNTYVWNPGNLSGASQVVLPSSTTIYTVTGTNTLTGCSALANVTVTVNTIPTINAGPTKSLTCASSFTTTSGSSVGGVSYNWTGSGIVSGYTTANCNVNAVGTLSVFAISAQGCASPTATVAIVQNTTPPSITASTTGSLTCSSLTVALNGTPPAGVTYLWSGPGVSGSTTTQNTSANAAGTYTLKVTSTANSCTNTAMTTVTQNTINPTVSSSVTNTLTCNTTTVNAIATTVTSPVTYTWSGTGIGSGNGTATITVNTAGTKSYTVTNTTNGCKTTGTVSVAQNTTTPVTIASSSGTITCITSTINLNSSLSGPNMYSWTATSGASIVSGAGSQNAVGSGAGIYSITVTNTVNGCAYTTTTTVSQNTTTPSGVNAGMDQMITCTTPNVTLTGGPGSGVTYLWSGPGISGSTTTQNTTANLPGTYTLVITDPVNGCTNNDMMIVSQNTITPTVSAGSDVTLTCASTTGTLSGSVVPGTSSINWTGGVCGSPALLNTMVCSPGTYTLNATDPSNGCTASSTVNVVADVNIPSVLLSFASATVTCFSPTVSVVATTTTSPVSYSWAPTFGIAAGTENTDSPVFMSAGSYSLVVTSSSNGCASDISSNVVTIVQNMAAPTISVSAPFPMICSGNSTTLTASGSASYDYVWTPGNLNGAIQTVSPAFTTSYSVVATNTINGCATTESISITVNATPVLAINGNTMICQGSTANLMASGVTSYVWDSGANTASISVTPTVTTTYTVTGDNGAGSCTASVTAVVSVVSSKDITGVITSTAGATTGDVTLYKYTANLSQWTPVATTSFTSSYTFSGMDSSLYVVRAVPTATNIQVTYGPNSISWQNATVITHGCTNNSNMNIDLIPLANFIIGPGILTGTVVQGMGFGQRMANTGLRPLIPGTPIGGIVVKGGKNPGGQMYVQTTTGSDGTYTLTGLPINSATESYFVFVDIPGLDTSTTYHKEIDVSNTEYDHLDFCVDSTHINPCGPGAPTISQEISVLENKITLFPNPAKQQVSIEYELTNAANVKIDLYDVIGNKVKEIVPYGYQEKDKYNHSINLESLSSGVYFVKLRVNSSENTIKLIINQ